jgi:hypothetical protein
MHGTSCGGIVKPDGSEKLIIGGGGVCCADTRGTEAFASKRVVVVWNLTRTTNKEITRLNSDETSPASVHFEIEVDYYQGNIASVNTVFSVRSNLPQQSHPI